MKIIVCLDERMGMMFHGRRLSRDRILIERVRRLCGERTLWMHPDSAVLFRDVEGLRIETATDFLDKSTEGDFCFVENSSLEAVQLWIEQLIIFWWNRRYPSDRKLDLKLEEWNLVDREEFAGSSHDKITKEVYGR